MTITDDQIRPETEATESTLSDELETPDTSATPDDEHEQESKPDREASKLRKRAQAAESERDTLSEQLTALRRSVVEDLAAAQNLKPAALWTVAELDNLLDDEGGIDVEKVNAAVESARDTLGVATVTKGSYSPGIGHSPAGKPQTNSFEDAFRPKR